MLGFDIFAIQSTGISSTVGSLLAGGFICVFLSGIVCMQTYLYHRRYFKDKPLFRLVVTVVWLLDMLHTVMVCIANWTYLISHFGQLAHSDVIAWSLALTIAITALVTFIAHCFFILRIHTLSKSNWLIAAPLCILALFRVVLAIMTTVEMIEVASFHSFVERYQWLLSLGLIVSCVVDVAIAISLCYYLRKNKSGFSNMDEVIDTLVRYTLENGVITSVVTILSLFFWFLMPNNLVFLAFHFPISKLYANSLLATLNSRRSLQVKSQGSTDKAIDYPLAATLPRSSRLLPGSPRLNRVSFNDSSRDNSMSTVRNGCDGQTIDGLVVAGELSNIDLEASNGRRSSMIKSVIVL